MGKSGRGRGVPTKTIQIMPFFEIRTWNLFSRIQEFLPRTKNFVEAWHNMFSNTLECHPLVYRLIDMFLVEQRKNEELLVK